MTTQSGGSIDPDSTAIDTPGQSSTPRHLDRQRARFGGIKWGSALLGCLAALGITCR